MSAKKSPTKKPTLAAQVKNLEAAIENINKTAQSTTKALEEISAILAKQQSKQTPEESQPAMQETPTQNPLEKLEEANGRIETDLDKLKSVESILGISQINPFGTTEIGVFDQRLESMTYADMQELARKVGINAYPIMPQLKENLRAHFMRENKESFGAVRTPQPVKTRKLDPNNPDDLKVMQMLGMKTV